MIKPTIGRVVLFHPHNEQEGSQPQPALICYVHSDTMINVGGFDYNGNPFSACSLLLIQDDSPAPGRGYYAEWMPYQKGQAAKYEALEQEKSALELAAAARAQGEASYEN